MEKDELCVFGNSQQTPVNQALVDVPEGTFEKPLRMEVGCKENQPLLEGGTCQAQAQTQLWRGWRKTHSPKANDLINWASVMKPP